MQLGDDSALGASGNGLFINGADAVLDLNGYSPTVGAVGLINGPFDGSIINSSTTPAALTASSYVVSNGTIDVDLYGAAPMLKVSSGDVTLRGGDYYTGLTTVCAGQLTLVGPDAWNPVLNGAGVNIQDGRLILDYSDDANSDPAATVGADLTESYHGSTHFSSGRIFCTTANSQTGLGWDDNTTLQQVTIARALYGDANLDGVVNVSDLSALGLGWRRTNEVSAQGDFNYDGTVNASDLTILGQHWHQQVGDSPVAPDVAAIDCLGSESTSANSVQFVVAFSEAVSGVDAGDFSLDCSGTIGSIASIVDCSSSDVIYLITVDNVYGNGTLGLSLSSDNSIVDAVHSLPLVGNSSFVGRPSRCPRHSSGPAAAATPTGPTVPTGRGTSAPIAGSSLFFQGTALPSGTYDDLPQGTSLASIELASSGFGFTVGAPADAHRWHYLG